MSKIKDKFTRIFRKNHVDVNEPVKTNVSDDYPFKYYEPPIPVEELQAKVDELLAEKAKGKKLETVCDYNDEEVLKEMFGDLYMTEEDRKERDAKIASGELVIISDDDPYRPYYPPVTLEESKANLRKLVETMKKEEQCGRMRKQR